VKKRIASLAISIALLGQLCAPVWSKPYVQCRLSRTGLVVESIKKGQGHIYIDDLHIRVYGDATRWELIMIAKSLVLMPKKARIHASDIYLTTKIGKVVDDETGVIRGNIIGIGGDGRMVIDRTRLNTLKNAQEVLYHEAAHNFDICTGARKSEGFPWGCGASISNYGNTSPSEDFAEVMADVITNWAKYTNYSDEQWASEPCGFKKYAIIELLKD
jgi:hypothetical protein